MLTGKFLQRVIKRNVRCAHFSEYFGSKTSSSGEYLMQAVQDGERAVVENILLSGFSPDVRASEVCGTNIFTTFRHSHLSFFLNR